MHSPRWSQLVPGEGLVRYRPAQSGALPLHKQCKPTRDLKSQLPPHAVQLQQPSISDDARLLQWQGILERQPASINTVTTTASDSPLCAAEQLQENERHRQQQVQAPLKLLQQEPIQLQCTWLGPERDRQQGQEPLRPSNHVLQQRFLPLEWGGDADSTGEAVQHAISWREQAVLMAVPSAEQKRRSHHLKQQETEQSRTEHKTEQRRQRWPGKRQGQLAQPASSSMHDMQLKQQGEGQPEGGRQGQGHQAPDRGHQPPPWRVCQDQEGDELRSFSPSPPAPDAQDSSLHQAASSSSPLSLPVTASSAIADNSISYKDVSASVPSHASQPILTSTSATSPTATATQVALDSSTLHLVGSDSINYKPSQVKKPRGRPRKSTPSSSPSLSPSPSSAPSSSPSHSHSPFPSSAPSSSPSRSICTATPVARPLDDPTSSPTGCDSSSLMPSPVRKRIGRPRNEALSSSSIASSSSSPSPSTHPTVTSSTEVSFPTPDVSQPFPGATAAWLLSQPSTGPVAPVKAARVNKPSSSSAPPGVIEPSPTTAAGLNQLDPAPTVPSPHSHSPPPQQSADPAPTVTAKAVRVRKLRSMEAPPGVSEPLPAPTAASLSQVSATPLVKVRKVSDTTADSQPAPDATATATPFLDQPLSDATATPGLSQLSSHTIVDLSQSSPAPAAAGLSQPSPAVPAKVRKTRTPRPRHVSDTTPGLSQLSSHTMVDLSQSLSAPAAAALSQPSPAAPAKVRKTRTPKPRSLPGTTTGHSHLLTAPTTKVRKVRTPKLQSLPAADATTVFSPPSPDPTAAGFTQPAPVSAATVRNVGARKPRSAPVTPATASPFPTNPPFTGLKLVVGRPAGSPGSAVSASRQRTSANRASASAPQQSGEELVGSASEDGLLTRMDERKLALITRDFIGLQDVAARLKIVVQGTPSLEDVAKAVESLPEVLQQRLHVGQAAKTLLIRRNMGLVRQLASRAFNMRRSEPLGITFEDLVEEGIQGLCQAICKFDADKGYKLSTYATPWIRQFISRTLTTERAIVRLPSHVAELLSKLMRMRWSLKQSLGRSPTPAEEDGALGWQAGRAQKLVELCSLALNSSMAKSMEGSLGRDGEDGDALETWLSNSDGNEASMGLGLGSTPEELLLIKNMEDLLDTAVAQTVQAEQAVADRANDRARSRELVPRTKVQYAEQATRTQQRLIEGHGRPTPSHGSKVATPGSNSGVATSDLAHTPSAALTPASKRRAVASRMARLILDRRDPGPAAVGTGGKAAAVEVGAGKALASSGGWRNGIVTGATVGTAANPSPTTPLRQLAAEQKWTRDRVRQIEEAMLQRLRAGAGAELAALDEALAEARASGPAVRSPGGSTKSKW